MNIEDMVQPWLMVSYFNNPPGGCRPHICSHKLIGLSFQAGLKFEGNMGKRKRYQKEMKV